MGARGPTRHRRADSTRLDLAARRPAASPHLDDLERRQARGHELRPGGRLDVLLSTAESAQTQHPPAVRPTPRGHKHRKVKPAPPRPTITPVPVTWAVDPMLVQDVQAMDAGYTLGSGSDQHAGTGRAAAHAWLAGLQAAASRGAVIGLPYADPDLVAVIRAGLTSEAQKASTLGRTLLDRALPSSSLPYAWPLDGFSDRRTLDTLADSGITTFLLDSTATSGGRR